MKFNLIGTIFHRSFQKGEQHIACASIFVWNTLIKKLGKKHIKRDWNTTFADETQVNSGIEHVTLLISLQVAAQTDRA